MTRRPVLSKTMLHPAIRGSSLDIDSRVDLEMHDSRHSISLVAVASDRFGGCIPGFTLLASDVAFNQSRASRTARRVGTNMVRKRVAMSLLHMNCSIRLVVAFCMLNRY